MPQGFSYAKWDKLELSDDEDFECHPNVDKASMVRWRQAEVHRVRRERQDKINALHMESEMNQKILKRLPLKDGQQAAAADVGSLVGNVNAFMKDAAEWDKKLAHDVMVMAHSDRDARWRAPEPDPFFMKRVKIEALLNKYKDALENSLKESEGDMEGTLQKMKTALEKLNEATVKEFEDREKSLHAEIAKEEAEKLAKMTSENIHEGFSKTVLSKEAPPKKTVTEKKTEIITLNNPEEAKKASAASSAESSSSKETAKERESAKPEDEDTDHYITDPAAEKFANMTDFEESYKFLGANRHLLSSKYSDEILAQAFQLEMEGKGKKARQYIQQSLTIQYCEALGKDGVMLFFQRMANSTHKAKETFMKDVADTYNRIHKRVKEIKKEEQEKEEEERRQGQARAAACLQEDGTYKLPLAEDATEEDIKRADVFSKIPPAFQKALLEQNVEEINEFLAGLTKEEAETMLAEVSAVGLISLQTED
ncbi:hsp90 co-chaperone Cdc37 [Chytridiales sp. JEL 0842]|nr:hsp90 co-chaperone Cdc37 [Chytridiales sp. JEL 0842]